MHISIDREQSVPLYLQIRNQIREAILRGNLAHGERLPPERRLAEELRVNRTTIVSAYRELAAEGFLLSHVGRGTVVNRAAPHDDIETANPLVWSDLFARQPDWPAQRLACEAADLASRSGAISLANGVPDPALYPLQAFREACSDFLRRSSQEDLAGSPVEGFPPLRAWLANWLTSRGLDVVPDDLLITSGSTQALDLIARAFVDPGDQVVVESPTSLSALRTFASARARLIPVPVDGDGIQVDSLAHAFARHQPKLIYSLPTFQNPTGVSLSEPRRRQLLDLAGLHAVPIVEEDPYSPLSFDAPAPTPLKALDRDGRVLYVGTLSKLLFPGLRVGWIAAPRPVAERLIQIKRNTDLFTGPVVQGGVWQLLSTMSWPAYLRHITDAYRLRRNTLLAALERHMPAGTSWQVPGGGFYAWVRLPDGILAQHLLIEAFRTGVAFLPGDLFCLDGSASSNIRLNFSYEPPDQLEEGIRRLSSALAVLLKRRREPRRPSVTVARTII